MQQPESRPAGAFPIRLLTANLCTGTGKTGPLQAQLQDTNPGIEITTDNQAVVSEERPYRTSSRFPPCLNDFGTVLAVRGMQIDQKKSAAIKLNPNDEQVRFGQEHSAGVSGYWTVPYLPGFADPDGGATTAVLSSRTEA